MDFSIFGQLITTTFNRFKNNLIFFSIFSIFPTALFLVFFVGVFSSFLLTGFTLDVEQSPDPVVVLFMLLIISVATLVFMVVFAFINAYASIAAYEIASKDIKNYTIKQLLLDAKGRVLPLFWVQFLSGLVIVGGLLLFIVPGIIFALWYMLATYVNLDERRSGMDALNRSKELTEGRRGIIFLFLFLFSMIVSVALNIVTSVLNIIPIIGAVASAYLQGITIGLFGIFGTLVYLQVKSAQKTIVAPATAKTVKKSK